MWSPALSVPKSSSLGSRSVVGGRACMRACSPSTLRGSTPSESSFRRPHAALCGAGRPSQASQHPRSSPAGPGRKQPLQHGSRHVPQGLSRWFGEAVTKLAAAAVDGTGGVSSIEEDLDIEISNEEDDKASVIRIQGRYESSNFLMTITGALTVMKLEVKKATIETLGDGTVRDVFLVVGKDGSKVAPERFDEVRRQLMAAVSPRLSSKTASALPAIYGMMATAEVDRLRPLSERDGENSPARLELAAAEMSQAAAKLVALERDILALMKLEDTTADALKQREEERSQAVIELERYMAAMDAAMKQLRAPSMPEKPVEEERHEGADLRFGSLGGGTGSGAAAGDGFEIFLQGFNWESNKQSWYAKLSEQLSFIAGSGITTIWMPPPSDSVSSEGYLPRDLYKLDTPYGSEAELRDVIKKAHDLGVKMVADIVINHRCASAQGDGGKWNKFGGRLPWDASVVTCDSHEFGGRGARSTGQVYAAAPNIDHTQEKVREDYKAWLNFLRNSIGFDGWRLDFVIGYAGEYCKEYINATVPELAFGEYWDTCAYDGSVLQYNQDAHRQRTVSWIDSTGGTAAAFDFTTKGILQEAVGRNERWRLVDPKGKPPGVIGMWPSRAVTFIDNHDTGSTLQHWPFPGNHLEEGYCYILTHPGSPCVFYDHFFDGHLGEVIRSLIRIRKTNRINARSKCEILKASADCYAAVIEDKVAMKMGGGDWSPNHANLGLGKWKSTCKGRDFCVWELEKH